MHKSDVENEKSFYEDILNTCKKYGANETNPVFIEANSQYNRLEKRLKEPFDELDECGGSSFFTQLS
ncbi:hypothetical protein AGMMS49944_29430 [Spirochaetia bacterium]|nr:hypothetical protein AGMMS49944_29430 [Spirochaetia bacterium]